MSQKGIELLSSRPEREASFKLAHLRRDNVRVSHTVTLPFRSVNVPLDMSLMKSSFSNAIFLVVAFTLAVQETAAQAVLCGQYQVLNSTSGQYISKSIVCASSIARHNLTRMHS